MNSSYIDWPRLLSDLAWLLGNEAPGLPHIRLPMSQVKLAKHLGFSRTKLVDIMGETRTKVEYHDGVALLAMWARLSGKGQEFAPVTVRSMSSAELKRAGST